jgi:CRP-like cAMP-binding protein
MWILVSGSLAVRKGATTVNTISEPGALVGEVSALLGSPYGATVEATAPSRLRRVDDGRASSRPIRPSPCWSRSASHGGSTW